MKVVNLLPSILKKSSASKPTKSKTTKKGKGIVTGTLKVVFFFFKFHTWGTFPQLEIQFSRALLLLL